MSGSDSKHCTAKSIFACQLNWLSTQFSLFTLNVESFVCSSLPCIHCALWSAFGLLRPFLHSLILPHFHYCISIWPCPKHNTRLRSLSMLVPRKKWTVPQLTRVYGRVRVPRDLESTLLPWWLCSSWSKKSKVNPFPSKWEEKCWEMTVNDESKSQKMNYGDWMGTVRLLVNVSSLNLSISRFPRYSDVDSGPCWIVVQNYRIPPQNGNLVEELTSWTEEPLFPYQLTWLSAQFSAFAASLLLFCLLICASLSRFTFPLWPLSKVSSFSHSTSLCLLHLSLFCPRHKSKRAFSRAMLVLSDSDTHYVNGYMAYWGCHEMCDQSRSSQGYMAWCGCLEILIALCYPQEIFYPDQKKSQLNRSFLSRW